MIPTKNEPLETTNMLFDALFKHDSAIDPLIREWNDAYEIDQADAMVELVNFLIQSTGCPSSIDRTVFDEEQDIAEVLSSLQEKFNAVEQRFLLYFISGCILQL